MKQRNEKAAIHHLLDTLIIRLLPKQKLRQLANRCLSSHIPTTIQAIVVQQSHSNHATSAQSLPGPPYPLQSTSHEPCYLLPTLLMRAEP